MSVELTNAQRAEVLTQALPYIQKYYNKIIVVKYGGTAMVVQLIEVGTLLAISRYTVEKK